MTLKCILRKETTYNVILFKNVTICLIYGCDRHNFYPDYSKFTFHDLCNATLQDYNILSYAALTCATEIAFVRMSWQIYAPNCLVTYRTS